MIEKVNKNQTGFKTTNLLIQGFWR